MDKITKNGRLRIFHAANMDYFRSICQNNIGSIGYFDPLIKIDAQKVELLNKIDVDACLDTIEYAARTCTASTNRQGRQNQQDFLQVLWKKGHQSVFEHSFFNFEIQTDRRMTHELVRHRIGVAYSQQSTRYVKANKDGVISFILPSRLENVFSSILKDIVLSQWALFKNNSVMSLEDLPGIMLDRGIYASEEEKTDLVYYFYHWLYACFHATINYHQLMQTKTQPQHANATLPLSLKTIIVVSYNWRSLMDVHNKRSSEFAHPQMQDLMRKLMSCELSENFTIQDLVKFPINK